MSVNEILNLNPNLIWKYFYEISQIPRPSKKEEKIIEYLENFAKQENFEYKKDKVGNIVIMASASKGYENSPTVVLQSHIDMVCEKNKGTAHDFNNDPLKLKIESGWVTAEGTTLGSDNGIGVAASLAVIMDEDIKHGPIECLFTVDEETGLTGANNLQPGFITGKILLNMDSEEMGAIYIGCAGGVDTIGNIPLLLQESSFKSSAYKLVISGLKGGHSGLDIHTGRGNAIKLLARILGKLTYELNYEIIDIEGGSKRNAIPRESEAIIKFDEADYPKVKSVVDKFLDYFKSEFNNIEPDLTVQLEEVSQDYAKALAPQLKKDLIDLLLALPHGVLAMSNAIDDLVETSTNLATINIENNFITIVTSQRSSIESAKYFASKSVEACFNLVKADVVQSDGYPGWQPNPESKLLKFAKDIFTIEYAEPEVKAIHAGLECGILSAKYPGMDIISFGPTIEGAHSPDEKVNIKTVEDFYNLLKKLLEKIAEQK